MRAVLYNLSYTVNAEDIKTWQESLEKHGFILNHKKDISKLKQIGYFVKTDIENNEISLTNALNKISALFSTIF